MALKEFIKTRCSICVIDCDFGFVQENAECEIEIDIEQRGDGSSCGFRIYCKTEDLPSGRFYACINERVLECYAARNVIMPWYAMREEGIKALFGIQK